MREISSTVQAARAMDKGDMLGASLQFWKGITYAAIPGDTEQTIRYKQTRWAAFQRDLAQGFVPAENMVRGVVSNAADHVAGSEPTWNLTGTNTARCEDVLTPCWNTRDLHSVLQDAIRTRIRDGEGAIRIRIPPGAIQQARNAGAADLTKSAARWLRFESLPNPEALTITEDENTLTLRATCDLGKDASGAELGTEIAYVDAQGFTVVALNKNGKTTTLWRLPLGGRLPYIQVAGDGLVTQGMVDNQSAANMVMTSATNNSALAGQIMEHFHNMQPQRDTDGKPLPALRGPGGELYTADTIAAQEVDGPDGPEQKPVILKGEYQRHGPVSSESLDFTLKSCERNIYSEAKQRHYLMQDKATATGEARKTAMSAFFRSLAPYRTDAVRLLRGLIETTLAMSYALCKQPMPDIEVEPVLTDRLAEPTPEDRAADLADVSAGIISKSDARARQGLINSDAVQKQINREFNDAQQQ